MTIVTPTSDAGWAKEGEQVHNLNRMPGFAAEASLYRAGNPYWLRGKYHRTGQNVYPADYIDQACLGKCKGVAASRALEPQG